MLGFQRFLVLMHHLHPIPRHYPAAASSVRSVRTMASGRPSGVVPPAAPFTDYSKVKWWSADTVAVVTGGNRGIGHEIARILAQQGLTTVLTARDERAAQDAAARIREAAGPSARVHAAALDLADPHSIAAFARHVIAEHGGRVGVLVNNAGFAYKGDVFGLEEARTTLTTNYIGTADLTEALLPALAPGGRVVFVSSRAGLSSIVKDQGLRQRWLAARDRAAVDALVGEFLGAVAADARGDAGALSGAGWPRSMYGISKLALNSYIRARAPQLAADKAHNITFNACCPGWCRTDMSSGSGNKTAAEGADTPAWLALRAPDDNTTGGFWGERTALEW